MTTELTRAVRKGTHSTSAVEAESAARIEVFDPALCCSSGVCGPAPDDALIHFAADLDWVRAAGTSVRRVNLGQEANVFVSNVVVRNALASRGLKCLPLVLVDGEIFTESRYPTRTELAERLSIAVTGHASAS